MKQITQLLLEGESPTLNEKVTQFKVLSWRYQTFQFWL